MLNNQCEKDAAAAAAAATAAATAAAMKNGRDFKRVHFSLETLNTRRLLARLGSTEPKVGGAKPDSDGGGHCENGGPPVPPAPSLASLLRKLPSTPPIPTSSNQSQAEPATLAPPPAAVASPPAAVAPPRPGELQQLQHEIEEMRERLRMALARRAELQTAMAKPTGGPSVAMPTRVALATVSAMQALPTATTAPAKPLPANTTCVTLPLQSQLTNQRS